MGGGDSGRHVLVAEEAPDFRYLRKVPSQGSPRSGVFDNLRTAAEEISSLEIADRAGQFLRALASRRSNWYRLGFPKASFLKSACWGLSR